jgi:hypothetical protein
MQGWVTDLGVASSRAQSVADAIQAAGFEDPSELALLAGLSSKDEQSELLDVLKREGVSLGDRTKIKQGVSRTAGRGRSPSPAAPPVTASTQLAARNPKNKTLAEKNFLRAAVAEEAVRVAEAKEAEGENWEKMACFLMLFCVWLVLCWMIKEATGGLRGLVWYMVVPWSWLMVICSASALLGICDLITAPE